MQRTKINLTDSPINVAMTMSEGNPGALRVIMELLQQGPMGLMDVLHFDDMGMRGPQIWIAYKDYCDCDIAKLSAALKARDAAMVDTVNAECPGKRAVTHGASF